MRNKSFVFFFKSMLKINKYSVFIRGVYCLESDDNNMFYGQ